MRVVYHSDFITRDLQEGDAYFAVPASAYLEIIAGKSEQITDAFINGSKVADYSRIPFHESSQLVVSVNGETKTFEVKAIVKLLQPEFSGAYGEFEYDISNTQGFPLDAIIDGTLKMYAEEQSADITDYKRIEEIFKHIDTAYPAFKRICDKPKSHLKAINEVKPIETVKRVGHESIPYLAAHSEDWLARTASGLKPARLFSRVEDDEFHIYENRFVKTAIDEIVIYLKRNRDNLKDQVSQIKGILDSSVQTNAFGFDAGFAIAVAELIQEDSGGAERRSKQLALAEKLLAEATRLWKKYRDLQHGRLHRHLKRAKLVTNPINETNILLMDKSYSVVFKFWKAYPRLNAPKESDKVSTEDLSGLQESYKLFCRMLCEYAAHTMGFEQTNEGEFVRRSDNIDIRISEQNGVLLVAAADATKRTLVIGRGLVCPIETGGSYKNFEFKNQTLFWTSDTTESDIDEFCSLLKTRESRGREQEEGKRNFAALKQAIDGKNRSYGSVRNGRLMLLTPFVDIEDETQNPFSDYMKSIVARFEDESDYTVIAMPKCKIPEQRLTQYARNHSEKLLFLPLTMFDINSYRRLQNLFMRLIISIGKDKHCPLCGSNIRGRECQNDNCGLMITETTCGNQKCKHKYIYCYNGRQEGSVESIAEIDPSDFYQYDSRFQYRDITPLTTNGKIIPICPKCGE